MGTLKSFDVMRRRREQVSPNFNDMPMLYMSLAIFNNNSGKYMDSVTMSN